MIEEKIIDIAAEQIGSQDESLFQGMIQQFKEAHPVVLAYIFSDNFKLLTSEESNLLLYIILVIRSSIATSKGEEPPTVLAKDIDIAEEKNWELMNTTSSKKFRERLDIFFTNTPQEDLLAFIEDLLMDEEEEIITKAGREYIFIAAKTVVDIWLPS